MNSNRPRHYPARIWPDIRPDSRPDRRPRLDPKGVEIPLSIRPTIRAEIGRIALAGFWPVAKVQIFSFPLPIRPSIRPETGRILGRIPGSDFSKIFPAFIWKPAIVQIHQTHNITNPRLGKDIYTCHIYMRKVQFTPQRYTKSYTSKVQVLEEPFKTIT